MIPRPLPDRAPVLPELGRSQMFLTRQAGDRTDVIRTFGAVVQTSAGGLRFTDGQATAYHRPGPPQPCAHGKVVAFSRAGRWWESACFQVADSGGNAELVACGNATAAAAAAAAAGYSASGSPPRPKTRVRMRVRLPGSHLVHVDARVDRRLSRSGEAVQAVRQTWSLIPFAMRPVTDDDGRMHLAAFGALNNYLVITAAKSTDISREEAIRLWTRFGASTTPLSARVAIVSPANGHGPRVKFFTCGGLPHPSAPLTGLAVLALVAGHLRSTGLDRARQVETDAGPMVLPQVRAGPRGTATIAFSDVVVELSEDAGRSS